MRFGRSEHGLNWLGPAHLEAMDSGQITGLLILAAQEAWSRRFP